MNQSPADPRRSQDRYQVFIKEKYPEKYKDYRWTDLELAKKEVGYPLNDEEALFSNEKWF